MKSLIWKEARQQLVWLFVALSLATQMWFGMGDVWKQLVLPIGEGFLVFLLWPLVYAFALAQLQFGRDGDERRFGQLVHRGRGARGYFASKVIVGCAAVACVIVLPVSVWALVKSASDPDAILIRWVRVPQIILYCVPAFVCYAVGVLSTQLRRGWEARWSMAICGIFSSFILFMPMLGLFRGGDPSLASVWGALSNVLTAALVLWLARSLLLAGRDRDLVLRDRHLVGLAVVAMLLVLPFVHFARGTVEAKALQNVREAAPVVLRDPRTNEFLAAVETEQGWRKAEVREGRIARVSDEEIGYSHPGFYFRKANVFDAVTVGSRGDEEEFRFVHRAGTPGWGSLEEEIALRMPESWPQSGSTDGGNSWSRDDHSIGWKKRAEFDPHSGSVELFATPVREAGSLDLEPVHAMLARPGKPFSPQTGLRLYDDTIVFLDRSDGTLWRVSLDLHGAKLDRVPVPADDEIVGMDGLVDPSGLDFGRTGFGASLFRGKKGLYTFENHRELVPFQDVGRTTNVEKILTSAALELPHTYADVSTWQDAFTEHIRIERVADRQPVFELDYESNSTAARIATVVYGALTFLRGPESVFRERFVGDNSWSGISVGAKLHEMRLFANGNRPLLFALVMLFGAFQLFVGWRWMARGGVGIGTRIVYMLLIATGGVVALLFTRLLLPRGPANTRANEAVSWTGDTARSLHASSPRS